VSQEFPACPKNYITSSDALKFRWHLAQRILPDSAPLSFRIQNSDFAFDLRSLLNGSRSCYLQSQLFLGTKCSLSRRKSLISPFSPRPVRPKVPSLSRLRRSNRQGTTRVVASAPPNRRPGGAFGCVRLSRFRVFSVFGGFVISVNSCTSFRDANVTFWATLSSRAWKPIGLFHFSIKNRPSFRSFRQFPFPKNFPWTSNSPPSPGDPFALVRDNRASVRDNSHPVRFISRTFAVIRDNFYPPPLGLPSESTFCRRKYLI
jgi:hypothetical protein